MRTADMTRKCTITLMLLAAATTLLLQVPARSGPIYLHWDSMGFHLERRRQLPSAPLLAQQPAEWWIRLDRRMRIERQTPPSLLPDNTTYDYGFLRFGRVQLRVGLTSIATLQWLRLSLWAPFCLFMSYPTFALLRGPLRSYRRHRWELCVKCGYSLTGNTSGVCPECGTKR
ncbi:MAG TPA: hypothetical protein VGQ93_06605 [Lysobacter sp.]|jgi:hypothetical protein|nr:hypothetical protein [Lysobacter sp.]